MARRWTPQRFMKMRRVRVAVCAITVAAMAAATFALTTRKAVALNVNGKTTMVTTYAMTVDRLLEEQDISVKSHDLVQSTSGGTLADHAVVTVRNAYQTTVNVDGEEIPFWTVADSADQLIGFFKANESKASSITVNIDNVYKQLTGGMVINRKGPVTVVADGKSSQAPNGKLPAASILDSKGITVGKEDKVSVTESGSQTVLRVQRVTHGQETRTKVVPFETQTIVDSSLQPGETAIRQQGENGEIQQTYNVTYVDGVSSSETLESETTTKASVNQVVAVGPAKAATDDDDKGSGDGSDKASGKDSDTTNSDSDSSKKDDAKSDTDADKNKSNAKSDSTSKGDTNNSQSTNQNNQNQNTNQNQNQNNQNQNSGQTTQKPSQNTNQSQNNNQNNSQNTDQKPNQSTNNNQGSGSSTSGRLWHPSVAQAQAYAAAAAAQRGWTGADWDALVWIWNHESSWLWNAENAYSGAYGIPQALPPDKMGAGYRDDAAVQIDWGLSYIAGRYGSPSQAKQWWLQHNWY